MNRITRQGTGSSDKEQDTTHKTESINTGAESGLHLGKKNFRNYEQNFRKRNTTSEFKNKTSEKETKLNKIGTTLPNDKSFNPNFEALIPIS